MTSDNEPETLPSVLILTPVKNAAAHLHHHVELIEALDWPRERLSIGFLEGDSDDGTAVRLAALAPRLARRCRRVTIAHRDFGFRMPPGVPRWAPAYQFIRRGILARARNNLLFRALDDEDWVLWIDVDLAQYPPDILRTLLATGFDIVHPHGVTTPGGPTFDLNAWADGGRATMQDLRGRGPVRLEAVGGTMLLVRADLHRDGLIFPPFRYGAGSERIRKQHPLGGLGEIETEGFGIMAADMGVQCRGLPDLETVHSDG